MKKTILKVTVAFLALTLAGCGTTKDNSKSDSSTSVKTEKKQVKKQLQQATHKRKLVKQLVRKQVKLLLAPVHKVRQLTMDNNRYRQLMNRGWLLLTVI